MKDEIDKLDIHKLVTVPVDLSKLSAVVKNDVFKKIMYDKLIPKVTNLDTSGFVLPTKYDTDKSEFEKKFRHTSRLVTKLDYNGKITKIENKIPDVSRLVKKKDYNTKISGTEKNVADHNHNKYITTLKF